jgi:predicted DNA-binding transcriptional regulator AlpA
MNPENPIIEFAGSAERYVKVEEIASFLSVKPQTILDWAKRYDDFPMVQLPGSIRVRPSEVTAWLEKLTERGRANQGRPAWKNVGPPPVVVTEDPATEKIA